MLKHPAEDQAPIQTDISELCSDFIFFLTQLNVETRHPLAKGLYLLSHWSHNLAVIRFIKPVLLWTLKEACYISLYHTRFIWHSGYD